MKGHKIEIFEYSKRIYNDDKTYSHTEKESTGKIGIFQEFGVDYEEFESGAGNYSVALVLMDDGTIESIPVDLVKFVQIRGQ